jgi:hypothetical protein
MHIMKITTTDNKLTIIFQQLEKFAGLKSKLEIPREGIVDIQWSPGVPDAFSFKGWRCPGTSVPGVFLAGSFSHEGHWEFFCVYLKRPGELRIETNHNKYQVIRITADPQMAEEALHWWKKGV